MLRTDKSVTVLTGLIIAALYVILLVGFTRESYMRRDASARTDGAAAAARAICRFEQMMCPQIPP